ncbi:hypothatical protein [Rhodovulum sp. PH10]|uniref:L,D-transpeptidase n=1 Tax=Rhodovulum sp. PH10 TaxID=1187851 RepID=UPI00027C2AF9|nr:L,D-transpeptidase [Rhodovulum sp. PH10]EJW12885.1 hypothatical protein [Rhodovulum sp. PH10]
MVRILIAALASTALVGVASAQTYYVPGPNGGSGARVAPMPVRHQPRSALGGGLLEAIFGGAESSGGSLDRAAVPVYGSATSGSPYGAQASLPDPSAYSRNAVDPRYLPQEVAYDGHQAPGTIVIDTDRFFLYLVEGNGRARRYGVGVGRPGFTWAGTHEISAKREWPDWRPPPEMLQRRPDLPTFMAGGPENPLGARALYLGSTLYRIHGSNEPWTIGTRISSGCIRMRNEDVIDLYGRVKVGTKVVVL